MIITIVGETRSCCSSSLAPRHHHDYRWKSLSSFPPTTVTHCATSTPSTHCDSAAMVPAAIGADLEMLGGVVRHISLSVPKRHLLVTYLKASTYQPLRELEKRGLMT